MLEVYLKIIGLSFIAAWFAMYLQTCFLYNGILGKLKFFIVSRFFDDEDIELYYAIKENRDLNAIQENDEYEALYLFVARRSKIVYLLCCSYCLASQLFFIGFLFINVPYGTYLYFTDIVLCAITGLSFIQFFLNFVKE